MLKGSLCKRLAMDLKKRGSFPVYEQYINATRCLTNRVESVTHTHTHRCSRTERTSRSKIREKKKIPGKRSRPFLYSSPPSSLIVEPLTPATANLWQHGPNTDHQLRSWTCKNPTIRKYAPLVCICSIVTVVRHRASEKNVLITNNDYLIIWLKTGWFASLWRCTEIVESQQVWTKTMHRVASASFIWLYKSKYVSHVCPAEGSKGKDFFIAAYS